MAVSPKNVEDTKRVRKISLSSIKNSLVRRSTRQSARSHVCCCESLEDANGEVEFKEKGVNCSKTGTASEAESEKCKCKSTSPASMSFNEKHKPGILKSLKKRFQLKANIGMKPFKLKSKQTIKAQDSSSSSYSLSEDSCEGFTSAIARQSDARPVPPPLRFIRDARNRPYTLNITLQDDNASHRLNNRSPDLGPSVDSVLGNVSQEVPPSPIRSVAYELLKLAKYGWYWGPISRDEAEEKLDHLPDGAFLVRDSSADRYLLSVSFRSSGKTFHTRIEHSHGLFSFYANPGQEGFESIVELITHSMSYSETAVFCYSRPRAPGYPAFPVRLVKPVSRFTQVRTLQYLCRFVIRQNTRVDNIQKLPLPTTLRGYIEEGHY